MLSPLIEKLIQALTCLPGVGPKSAQRMAFQLLERNRAAGVKLSQVLGEAMREIKRCERCRTFTELFLCNICSDAGRDSAIICVVETPADVVAIEQAGNFKGLYFVLMGHLSPIDGIGPEELGIPEFLTRVQNE
ncbi:MAG: recombination protein RecR, partial [Legionellales bacterium]